jgi:hypothetical protein
VWQTTLERFLADPKAADVFKSTVAAQIKGIQLVNVIIMNVTEVDPSTLNVFAEPEFRLRHPIGSPFMTRLEEELALLIRYRLVFIAQRVTVSNSNPTAAYQLARTQLTQAVSSGAFTTTLQTTAVVKDSPAFLNSTTEIAKLAIDTDFTTIVTHSAIPTSQPSTQPSGEPTTQPSSRPSAQPTSVPSMQPSLQPTGQPSSVPTLTMETKWRNALEGVFSLSVYQPNTQRTSYYAMDVSGESLYGSCESWNAYVTSSLLTTREAKAIDKLEFIVQTAESYARAKTYACTDAAAAVRIVDALIAPPLSQLDALLGDGLRKKIECSDTLWVVEDCHTDQIFSRALCVNCSSPCAEYNCTSHTGSTVLSPCTHQKTCPYLKGSMQVLTSYYHHTNGTGPTTVALWFAALWVLVLTVVTLYNNLILRNKDWNFIRGLPDLAILHRRGWRKKVARIAPMTPLTPAPEVVAPAASSLEAAVQEAYNTVQASRSIVENVAEILSRLMIAVGKHRAVHGEENLPFMQTFWYQMVNYNHYLAPLTRITQKERFLRGLDVVTRVTWLSFSVALCFYYNYPDDDETCYYKSTAQECGARKSVFDSNEEYCSWVGLTGPDSVLYDGNQPLHQTQCLWRLPTGSVTVSLHVIVFSLTALLLPRLLYTNLLLEAVILAPEMGTDRPHSDVGGRQKLEPIAGAPPREDSSVKKAPKEKRHAKQEEVRTPKSSKGSKGSSSRRGSPQQRQTASKKVELESAAVAPAPVPAAAVAFTPSYLKRSSAAAEQAKAMYHSFLIHFTRHRDKVVRDTPDSENFTQEWLHASPFLTSCKGTRKELRDDVFLRQTAGGYAAKLRIMEELVSVHNGTEALGVQCRALLPEDQEMFSLRLMVAFLADLLGKDSVQCRLVRMMIADLMQDRLVFRNVYKWVKVAAVALIVVTNVLLAFGSVMLLQHFAQRRQWYWVITAVLAVLVDMVVVESVEALWFQWALPLCVADTLHALRHTFLVIVRKFQSATLSAPLNAGLFDASDDNSEQLRMPESALADKWDTRQHIRGFSMPNYQFIATNVARKFPTQLASRIILSYESVFARTVARRYWPVASSSWTSGLEYESIGFVLFGNMAMWVGTRFPVCAQQVMLTGITSLVIYLISAMIRSAMEGRLNGVYAMLVLVGLTLLAVKSFDLSWGGDSAKFAAGVQCLVYDEEEWELEARRQRDVESALPSPVTRLTRSVKRAVYDAGRRLYGALSPRRPSSPLRPHSPLNDPAGQLNLRDEPESAADPHLLFPQQPVRSATPKIDLAVRVLSARSQARAVFKIDEDSDETDNEQKRDSIDGDLQSRIDLTLGTHGTAAGPLPRNAQEVRRANSEEQHRRRTLTPRSQARAVYILHPDADDSPNDHSDGDKKGDADDELLSAAQGSLKTSAVADAEMMRKEKDWWNNPQRSMTPRSQARAIYNIHADSDDTGDEESGTPLPRPQMQQSLTGTQDTETTAAPVPEPILTASQRRAVFDIGDDSDGSREEKETAVDPADYSPPLFAGARLAVPVEHPTAALIPPRDARDETAGELRERKRDLRLALAGLRAASADSTNNQWESHTAAHLTPDPRFGEIQATTVRSGSGAGKPALQIAAGSSAGSGQFRPSGAKVSPVPDTAPPAQITAIPMVSDPSAQPAVGSASQASAGSTALVAPPLRSHFDLVDSDDSSADSDRPTRHSARTLPGPRARSREAAVRPTEGAAPSAPQPVSSVPMTRSVYDIGDSDSD